MLLLQIALEEKRKFVAMAFGVSEDKPQIAVINSEEGRHKKIHHHILRGVGVATVLLLATSRVVPTSLVRTLVPSELRPTFEDLRPSSLDTQKTIIVSHLRSSERSFNKKKAF